MLGKSPNQNQRELYQPLLSDFINMNHDLVLLADRIDWKQFEKDFSPLYSSSGQKANPIRLMVGCLILKQLYNLGDETLPAAWVRDPYMQYFCGEAHFQHRFPFHPSDFVYFRKRIGSEGVELIFKQSVSVHGKRAESKMVLSDTTVQENFIEFPTDARLLSKGIDLLNRVSQSEGIELRQSYKRVKKQMVRDTHNAQHPKRAKKAKAAKRKLRTICGRLLRETGRKLSEHAKARWSEELSLCHRVYTQNRTDKNKVYSFHKPHTACIAKGKAHKKYEFGNKVGVMVHPDNLLVLGVLSFEGNPHDSHTIEPLLNQMNRLLGHLPKEVVYDRGGRGRKEINGILISTPGKPLKHDSDYARRCKRKKFRRRAAIEPLIGHLKTDHRMAQNYLWGKQGAQINAMMASAGWNFKKWMQWAAQLPKKVILALIRNLIDASPNVLQPAQHKLY